MPFSSSASSTQQNDSSSSTLRKRHQKVVAQQQKPLKAKVVVLGNTGVGKTSILLRHDGQGFTSKMSSTLGASYICSRSKIHNGREFELQIWDTAGQERFRSMVPLYMRNTSAAVLVFDITNRQSFRDLENWIKEVERIDETGNILLFIVANKCDLGELQAVTEQEGRQYAEKRNAHYFETSALSGRGIETAMSAIAEDILKEEQRALKERQELAHSSFNLAQSPSQDDAEEGKPSGKKNVGCCFIL